MDADTTRWTTLVTNATAAADEPARDTTRLGAAVLDVAGRVIPARQLDDQCAFEALRATGRAFAKAGALRRVRMASALGTIAAECARVLNPPVVPKPAPRAKIARTPSPAEAAWTRRADCGAGE